MIVHGNFVLGNLVEISVVHKFENFECESLRGRSLEGPHCGHRRLHWSYGLTTTDLRKRLKNHVYNGAIKQAQNRKPKTEGAPSKRSACVQSCPAILQSEEHTVKRRPGGVTASSTAPQYHPHA